MGNRRKTKQERLARQARAHGHQHGPQDHPFGYLANEPSVDSALSRMFRSSCDECGSPVKWVEPDEAEAHELDLDGAMGFLDVDDRAGLDIWICTQCENGGVMGKAEFG